MEFSIFEEYIRVHRPLTLKPLGLDHFRCYRNSLSFYLYLAKLVSDYFQLIYIIQLLLRAIYQWFPECFFILVFFLNFIHPFYIFNFMLHYTRIPISLNLNFKMFQQIHILRLKFNKYLFMF